MLPNFDVIVLINSLGLLYAPKEETDNRLPINSLSNCCAMFRKKTLAISQPLKPKISRNVDLSKTNENRVLAIINERTKVITDVSTAFVSIA